MRMDSIIDIVTSGISELSELSSDEESDDERQIMVNIQREEEFESAHDDDRDYDEDDIPLAQLATNPTPNNDTTPPSNQPYTYRWRKKDRPISKNQFLGQFSDPPIDDMTPMEYFKTFFTEEIMTMIVEQTNLYSTQKHIKCINTNIDKMLKFFGMHIHMGLVNLPAYTLFWSQSLRYPPIADVMPLKRFEALKRSLHVFDNTTYDAEKDDKLFKIRPLIEAVRNECIKVDPEEYQSVDEQIIPSKTRRTKILPYNPKKPKKWGFKNMVRAGASGYMYDFYVYAGKDEPDHEFQDLQKCVQVVAKLCKALSPNIGHKVFFDNWFSTLDLMQKLKKKGLLAVGTIRPNRLQRCPLKATKDLEKEGRGAMDYRTGNNSDIIITKWVDNKTLHLISNYVSIEPMESIQRWSKYEKRKVQVPCPQIVVAYNKAMGGVDLADMLISFYRIPVKTHRWYIKTFWHLVDIAKVNDWLLCRRHCDQIGIPKRSRMTLLNFTKELSEALIHARQPVKTPSRGRPTKRSLQADEQEDKENKKREKFQQHLFLVLTCDMMRQSIGLLQSMKRKDADSVKPIAV